MYVHALMTRKLCAVGMRNVILKAMLHEAIFLATCNATNVALQVARKNSRVTPHFATALSGLSVLEDY